MKTTNKQQILELLENNLLNDGEGLNTIEISEKLAMQRTNVSRLLNELVQEGYAIKSENKRPVVYLRSNLDFEDKEQKIFGEIVGWNGSLKKVIHLAKAAVMYPNKSLHTLLIAPKGSGKSIIAKKMHDYAISQKNLDDNAPFIKLDCLNYKDNAVKMNQIFKEKLNEVENGYFYIENWHLLDYESKNIISSILDENAYEDGGKMRYTDTLLICALEETANLDEFSESIRKKFSIVIDIPMLDERGLSERFQIIQKYMYEEAAKSNCSFSMNSETLISLLLYNCNNSMKQLKNDIRQACASAYVRQLESKNNVKEVLIMDFPIHVRSGLLNYKNRYTEVDQLITAGSNYIFDN